MVTYLYWIFIFVLVAAALWGFGYKLQLWKPAMITTAVILVIGILAYYFHFQQIFVKRYGGVMTVSIPEGQLHIAATWKDETVEVYTGPIFSNCRETGYCQKLQDPHFGALSY